MQSKFVEKSYTWESKNSFEKRELIGINELPDVAQTLLTIQKK